jgi:hypothetical protein
LTDQRAGVIHNKDTAKVLCGAGGAVEIIAPIVL